MKAEIRARQIVILGSVTGNLVAREKIEIRRNGHVVGDLLPRPWPLRMAHTLRAASISLAKKGRAPRATPWPPGPEDERRGAEACGFKWRKLKAREIRLEVRLRPRQPAGALQWLWQYLSHRSHPRVFDCGPIHQSTLNVLLLRGAKLYVTDLITPAQQNDSAFWSRQEKTAVFLIDDFLAQIPAIPPDSISAICSWGLLDALPREALPRLMERLHSYLEPGGVLFGILREPYPCDGRRYPLVV